MSVLCPNGHDNDPNNRFCEQCGARLEVQAASPAVGGGSRTCPECGAVVAHDEAFCDSCGAALPRGNEVVSSYDAPTVYAPTPPGSADAAPPLPEPAVNMSAPPLPEPPVNVSAPPLPEPEPSAAPAPAAQGGTCPVCGYQNMPDDRFCDQCGAALKSAPASGGDAPATVMADAPTIMEPAVQAPVSPPPADPVPMPQVPLDVPPSMPVEEPPAAEPVVVTPLEEASAMPTPAVVEAPPAPTPPAEAPVSAGAAGQPSDEERRLEELVGTERDNVAMFEQMAARYQGREAPAHVTAGLEEARRTLADAEAQLARYREDQASAQVPQPDPAEVTRLQDLVATERDNVAMFEQMAARYQGRAVPAHVTAGLEEARRTLADAEAQLAALTGGAPAPAASTSAAAPVSAPAPVEVAPPISVPPPVEAAPSPPVPPTPVEAAPVPAAAPAQSPTPAAPAAGGVLIVEGTGARIPLSGDKREFVIGREDPVSGIFPEVDLTPHGGEAGGVSRQHARLTREDGRWMLTDLESTNYTKVDGSRIQPHTPTQVNPGAKLQFGRVVVTFQAE